MKNGNRRTLLRNGRGARRLVGLALGAAVALVLAAPVASGAESQDTQVGVGGNGALTFHVVQTWDGADAPRFKRVIDTYFGNRDGVLQEQEVARTAAASRIEVKNGTVGAVKVDGAGVMAGDVQVALEGAKGDVTSESPIQIVHDVVLAEPLKGGSHRVTVKPIENGTLTVTVPSGYSVNGQDGGSVKMELKRGEEVGFDVTAPALFGIPGLPSINGAPGLGLVAFALALGVGAIALRRRV